MPATLIVKHENDIFSVGFKYEDVSDLQKWNTEFNVELVSIILNHRPSYAVVYDSSNKFKFDPFEIEKSVGKAMKNGETYLYAGPGKWSQKDIENIVLEDGFELSEIWFYIPSKEKAEEINPIELFENIFHLLNGDEEYVDESKNECLGRCEDGAVLLWQNPNPADLKRLKNALPELCHKYNYVMKHMVNAEENTEKFVFHFHEPHNGANFNHIHHDIQFLANVKEYNEEYVPQFDKLDKAFLPRADEFHEVILNQFDRSSDFRHIHQAVKRGANVAESALYNGKRFDIRFPKEGANVDKDFENGTYRNTIKTGANVAGGWGGGYAGAAIGGIIGSFIFPGIGTVVGGIFGAVTGSMGAD